MALSAALLLSTACSDDGDDNGNGNGGADAGVEDTGGGDDAGSTDTGGPTDTGGGEDAGPSECRFDDQCPAGEVCNLITKACEPGRECLGDSDCDVCSQIPIESSEECGHGLHLTAYCDQDRFVCTRSRASCEPCETDADCGRLRIGPLQYPMYCIDYSEVNPGLSGKFCARPGQAPAFVKGFERRPLGPPGPGGFRPNVFVNPNGCPESPDELFICPITDTDGDGVAEQNPNCDVGIEAACVDEACPGTGGLRCANSNLPGVTPICGDYCNNDGECPTARPFCNVLAGVCQTGCSPGACPNEQVCHVNGECGPPCHDGSTVIDAQGYVEPDQFCVDEYGTEENQDAVYCNILNRPRTLDDGGKLSKNYRDANACAPLGCERGQGDQINRDCGSFEICDLSTFNVEGQPQPQCVPGCFSGGDCVPQEDCFGPEDCPAERPNCLPNPNDPTGPGICRPNSLDNPQVFRCVDAPAGQVEGNRLACRDAFFTNGLDDENRDSQNPTIGTCCETGCITRNGDCVGAAAFCCNELDSPYEDPESCLVVEQKPDNPDDEIQATPGLCFEAPVEPFCQQCNPMNGNNDCNFAAVDGLVDEPNLPYNPATVWPIGENQDCQDCTEAELEAYTALGGQVNDGNPFYEVQRCVNLGGPMQPPYFACTVGYDPKKVQETGSTIAAGLPRGWECNGRAPPCIDDTQCNGLSCVGVVETPDGIIPGACKCGEDGVPSTACPATINGIPGNTPDINAGDRMRCVEARTRNYQGPQSSDVVAGDMFCVWTFDCTGPRLQVPDGEAVPQTLPDACNIPAFYRD